MIGIVAGRIKEKTGKPAIVIALDAGAGNGKGSGRSITGVDLGAAIIAAREARAADRGRRPCDGGGADRGARTRSRRLADWLDERLGSDVARASADQGAAGRRGARPRGLTPPLSMRWKARALWHGLAGPARRHGAGAPGQGRYRRHRSRPRDCAGDDGARFKAIAFRAARNGWASVCSTATAAAIWLAGRAKIDDWGSTPEANCTSTTPLSPIEFASLRP